MKISELIVVGEVEGDFCPDYIHTIHKELKEFMLEHHVSKIDIALVPEDFYFEEEDD